MASQICVRRLQKDLKNLEKNPLPRMHIAPNPGNILEWHYVLEGSPDTEYDGGLYHGKIMFPPKFPYAPPSITMLTPNGRFKPGERICMSMSDFHPESWNPLWGVSQIALGLQSFFYEDSITAGAMRGVSAAEKKVLASQSLEYNIHNPMFRKLFPELTEAHQRTTRVSNTIDQNGMEMMHNASLLRQRHHGKMSVEIILTSVVIVLISIVWYLSTQIK